MLRFGPDEVMLYYKPEKKSSSVFDIKYKDDNIHRSSAKDSLKSLNIQNLPIPATFIPLICQKWLPYQILGGGKPVKNVQIDPRKMEKKLNDCK